MYIFSFIKNKKHIYIYRYVFLDTYIYIYIYFYLFQYVHTFFDFGNRQHKTFLFILPKNSYPPQISQGPPGTGKTSIAAALVKEAQEQGLQVLWTVFTAQLAARARKQLGPGVTVDTCHAALGFDLDLAECRLNLAPYSLVIIDEFSQLEAKHLKHLVKLYDAVDRGIAIGLLGDRFQMGGFGEERIWHCREWTSHVHLTNLHHLYRCKDEGFRKMLKVLRTTKPSDTEHKGRDTLTVAQITSNKRRADGSHTNTAKHPKPPIEVATHHFHGSITQRHQSPQRIGNTGPIPKLQIHQNLGRQHRIQPRQL